MSYKLYQKYLQPLASNPTTGVFNSAANANTDSTQYLAKVDQVINPNNHLIGRYFYNQDNFQRPFNAPLGFFALNLFRNQSAIISDTELFSPSLTGTFSFSAGRFARTQIPEAPGLQSLQDLGQNVPLGAPGESIFPGIRANISGFVDIFSGGALTQDSTSFDYKAAMVKLKGAHTISFGAEFERIESIWMIIPTRLAITRSVACGQARQSRTFILVWSPNFYKTTAVKPIFVKTGLRCTCRMIGKRRRL